MLDFRIVSPLTKVFSDCAPDKSPVMKKGSALRGEKYSFQLAYACTKYVIGPMKLEVADSPLKPYIKLLRVVNVVTARMGDCVDRTPEEQARFERIKPGLFPDLLKDDVSETLYSDPHVWYSVWVEVCVPKDFKAGKYPLSFTLHEDAETSVTVKFELEVIGAMLPPQTLTHTEWFYCDCLAQAYNTAPWSPKFWKILEVYLHNFVDHGINMLYTPIVTPALDTEQGGERLTTQLVKVTRTKGKYSFDFSLLKRWIRLARKCGVQYFEMSHLFTQGGAKFCPKVVADVDGKKDQRIFGWDVEALSPSYKKFLDAMLPALVDFLKAEGVAEDCYFHISDEPNGEQVEQYKAVSRIVRKHLSGFRMLDAASHTQYFTEGLVTMPVPCEFALNDFLPLDIPERWTYYCGGPDLPYSNRILSMPASANRIMGTLLYVYEVEGFLHWGYNFWNSGRSRHAVNPLGIEPDHDYHSGDQCLVYPGPEGPLDSMRSEVFYAGLQDQRALQLLESLAGREVVMKLIKKTAGKDVKIDDFPLEQDFLHRLREAVNAAVKKHIGR